MTHELVRGIEIDGKHYNVTKRNKIVGGPYKSQAEATKWAKARSHQFGDFTKRPRSDKRRRAFSEFFAGE